MKWIDVNMKMPPKGERVLFCVSGGFVGEGYTDYDNVWHRMTGYRIDEVLGRVVAWMPMPEGL